jgi:beta-ribofuranosylaminobenzene 5'-phosphate synthase
MTEAVHVRAPCRLHFGMFSFGHADRPQFGGVGIMIDPPAVEVEISPAASFTVAGALAERARQFSELAAAAWQLPTLPQCEIAVRAPSDHIGLGVGTQLGLAIAAGLRRWLRLTELSIEALAKSVGRANRSAVGTYGFQRGGLIVDAGIARERSTDRLKRRLEIPSDWRLVLVRAENRRGLAGAHEADAFARLPPVPEHITRELWRITELEMLPALERSDCDAFGDAVYQFGRLAGECFALVQGGPFADAAIARLVERIRDHGIRGVCQSSWGPTVLAICRSQAEAEALVAWLRECVAPSTHEITIANPNNLGAVIR